MTSPYAREGFHPSCTVRTTFSGLQTGDVVDYWGEPNRVVSWHEFNDGRVRIVVQQEYGQQFALGPGSEPVWRQPRPTSLAPRP